ncbi:hypothetical protein [Pseudomonas sp. 28 E 9]|uniref:hypothetical protein n=1 Tax=Pseudomonas sp. 28 E 9 TaxID=1844098 RepID=UPI000812AD44|nr:hypothetical protein [Pseudomonas sp. 28 E 9]CRL97376.1 hypothetical protein [Pseudomonas sp. 28 E 9]CRM06846.1 hypothetical protein [Pseudomonas sp. 28 E 9]
MADLTKAYISQAIFISSTSHNDRVRYRQEDAENIFGSLFGSQSQQTNIPDELDASAPRLIFQSAHKQFLISKNSAQLVLGFQNADKPLKTQTDVIRENVLKVAKKVYEFGEVTGELGLVVTFNLPRTEPRTELSKKIYDKFLRTPAYGTLASSSFKVGFETEQKLYLNLEVDVYEMRRGVFNKTHVDVQNIDFSKLEVQETGFSFKVDINNKPRFGSHESYITEVELVMRSLDEFISTRLEDHVKL